MQRMWSEVLLSARSGAFWAIGGAVLALLYHHSSDFVQDGLGFILSMATNASFLRVLAFVVLALGGVEFVRRKESGHILAAKFLRGGVLRVLGIGAGFGLVAGLLGAGWTLALMSLGYGALVLFMVGALVARPPVKEASDTIDALNVLQ
ncbi:MAG: hypothetical protein EOP21_08875 [Hyphomicrobiales bacterium]|nr:MAG: hypothetical protein EOP21_08875 [Hyphomicrobiales bacterium]